MFVLPRRVVSAHRFGSSVPWIVAFGLQWQVAAYDRARDFRRGACLFALALRVLACVLVAVSTGYLNHQFSSAACLGVVATHAKRQGHGHKSQPRATKQESPELKLNLNSTRVHRTSATRIARKSSQLPLYISSSVCIMSRLAVVLYCSRYYQRSKCCGQV